MSMDKKTVEKVAHLARLDLKEDEIDRMQTQLSGILQWVEKLGEVDTDGVEPLANVVDIELELREDKDTGGDDVMVNAPEKTQGFFVVPKIVE